MPPPSVIPPMPTEPVSPKPVARPCSPAAVVYSPAVSPVSAQAVRPSTSMSSARMSRQVEHHPALGYAVARGAVTAAADGQLQPALAGERDRVRHVVGVGRAHDQRGTAVDRAEEDRARLVVVGVVRADHAALEFVGKLGRREHVPQGCSPRSASPVRVPVLIRVVGVDEQRRRQARAGLRDAPERAGARAHFRAMGIDPARLGRADRRDRLDVDRHDAVQPRTSAS